MRRVPWKVAERPFSAFTIRPWTVGQYSCDAQPVQGLPGMWWASAVAATATSTSRDRGSAKRNVRDTEGPPEVESARQASAHSFTSHFRRRRRRL